MGCSQRLASRLRRTARIGCLMGATTDPHAKVMNFGISRWGPAKHFKEVILFSGQAKRHFIIIFIVSSFSSPHYHLHHQHAHKIPIIPSLSIPVIIIIVAILILSVCFFNCHFMFPNSCCVSVSVIIVSLSL